MDIILSLLTLWIVRFVFVKEGTNVVVTKFGKYVKTLTLGMQSFFSLWGLMLDFVHRFCKSLKNKQLHMIDRIAFNHNKDNNLQRRCPKSNVNKAYEKRFKY